MNLDTAPGRGHRLPEGVASEGWVCLRWKHFLSSSLTSVHTGGPGAAGLGLV